MSFTIIFLNDTVCGVCIPAAIATRSLMVSPAITWWRWRNCKLRWLAGWTGQYVKPPLFAICSGYKPQKAASAERTSIDRERQNGMLLCCLASCICSMPEDMQEESLHSVLQGKYFCSLGLAV